MSQHRLSAMDRCSAHHDRADEVVSNGRARAAAKRQEADAKRQEADALDADADREEADAMRVARELREIAQDQPTSDTSRTSSDKDTDPEPEQKLGLELPFLRTSAPQIIKVSTVGTMEVTDQNMLVLASHLEQTLHPDPAIRKPAEKILESVEQSKNYSILLLSVIDKQELNLTIRVAGAIAFKNFVKRHWEVEEDGDNKIHDEDRTQVKRLIVNLMLKSPDTIQRQLSDAISVIGREDFPKKWPDLLNEMVERFGSGDFHVINGVLHTAHSLFKRYRYEFKSNDLWSEIIHVLKNFAPALTQLFIGLMELAKQHEENKDALKVIYSSLVMVAKIFNSLNFQDLPEYFKDNMRIWMDNFYVLLEVENPLLRTGEDEEAGLLEQLKSQICDNVGMYAQKYDEEFTEYLPKFVTAVWKLLVTTGNQPKYDLLVSNAIQFLALVADRVRYKQLFEDPATMTSICEKVIIPNMEFRETDEELFEDNAEEYIRRDIEGSDIDTRRRAACDLVRALSRHFEQQMTAIFGQCVQAMLARYAENPAKNWNSKDAAIYLVTSLASKLKTEKHGITITNQLVNCMDFYQSHIVPDLSSPNVNEVKVLKADAIKYVMIFRNQLPQSTMKESIPHLIRLLTAESPVVHTYAACAIDKILLLRQTDNSALIKPADLAPVGTELLSNLFRLLDTQVSKDNEYVMKAVMRSFSALQDGIIPLMEHMLPKLTGILTNVSKNPTKPHFNHYLFESLSLAVRVLCKSDPQNVGQFEKKLFPIFEEILTQDVTEFIPYTFQILSLLLDMHSNGVPPPYMDLFPSLLAPILWDRPANIHPLVKLLQAYITKGPQQIVATDKLSALLRIFQKLIASKTNDHEGFYLVSSIVENLPEQDIGAYKKRIFVTLQLGNLTSSKTTKYVKSLLVFFGVYICKLGAASFIQLIDSIQAKMFGKVVVRLLIAETQKVTGAKEKNFVAVGLTKLLCEAPLLLPPNGEYSSYWVPLLQTLIGLFELPEDSSVPLDEHFVEIEDTPGYETTYSQLIFAGKADVDPFHGAIPDAKIFLAESLGKLSAAQPGRLPGEAQAYLTKYLQVANVQII